MPPHRPGRAHLPAFSRLRHTSLGALGLDNSYLYRQLFPSVASNRSDLAVVLQALADPTRQQLVEMLSAAPRRAGELAERTGVAPPSISKHLRVLLRAGIVIDERVA